jgi:hypothetical protein
MWRQVVHLHQICNVRGLNGGFLGIDDKPKYARHQIELGLKRLKLMSLICNTNTVLILDSYRRNSGYHG